MKRFVKALYRRGALIAGDLKKAAYYRRLEKAGQLPPVRWITWEATAACNSRCTTCNIWKGGNPQKELTFEELKKVFSDPLLKNLETLLITGGEAVLRNDLLDVILFVHQQLPAARQTISTNGLLPDKVLGVVTAALEKGAAIDVGVSLDGVGEHHDRIRGVPGNFEKTDYLLGKLVELKKQYGDQLGFVAGQTLHPSTIDYVDEVCRYAKQKGVTHFLQLYDEAPYYNNVGDTAISKADLQRMIDKVKEQPPSFHNEVLLEILHKKIIRFDCFTMRTFFILRANGDVMPCLRLCDMKIGNVRDASISEIWHSEAARKTRETVRDCRGCANTWATDWSRDSNCLPFAGISTRAFIKHRLAK